MRHSGFGSSEGTTTAAGTRYGAGTGWMLLVSLGRKSLEAWHSPKAGGGEEVTLSQGWEREEARHFQEPYCAVKSQQLSPHICIFVAGSSLFMCLDQDWPMRV